MRNDFLHQQKRGRKLPKGSHHVPGGGGLRLVRFAKADGVREMGQV